MPKEIIVIGAGIIGASAAFHLQKAGAAVTVIDAGFASATQASFGWINASYFLDADHFALRSAGIAAYRALRAEIALPINWCGCICCETKGADLEAQRDGLLAQGYHCDIIDAQAFTALAPDVANPPARSLLFPQEAAGESASLAQALLSAAVAQGARVIRGVRVQDFAFSGDRVTGVRTDAGVLQADSVVSAVGAFTESLLAKVDVHIPLLSRPAVVVKTRPLRPILQHILVSELGELRQLPDGSLLMPGAIGHQSDANDSLDEAIDVAADRTMNRLRAMLPKLDLDWDQVTLAQRPVPQDERPVAGPVKKGLYVACMHSGITLGAVMGQDIATEVLSGPSNATAKRLAPYRPDRFA